MPDPNRPQRPLIQAMTMVALGSALTAGVTFALGTHPDGLLLALGASLALGAAVSRFAKAGSAEQLDTSRKVTESLRDEFRLLSDLTSDGAYRFGAGGDAAPLEWASAGFYRLTGWRPGVARVWSDWVALIHLDDRPGATRNFAAATAASGSITEFRLATPDGCRWVEDVMHPVTGERDLAPPGTYGCIRDITDRKTAQLDLARANAELEAAFAALPDLYLRVDAAGRFDGFRAANNANLILLPDEVIGRTLEEVLPAAVATQARLGIERIRTTGLPTIIEHRFEVDGQTRWFEARGFPGRNETIHLFVRDISKRKTREQKIAASERRFRTLVTSLPEPLLIAEDDRVVLANQAAVRFFGLADQPSLIGRPLSDLAAEGWSELLESAKTLEPESQTEVEIGFRRHDGSMVAAEVIVAPTEFDGRPARQIGFRDVTLRKAAEDAIRDSEERFRQLAESADGAFWLADPTDRTVPYLSPQFATLFGFDVADPADRIRAWSSAIHPGDREQAVRTLRWCLEGRISEFDIDYRISRPDGMVRWINDRARRIPMREGTRVLGFARDVTERRLANEARERLEAQVRNVQKMEAIGTLAGGIAHDFNNILGVIMGYASLLELELRRQPRQLVDLGQILTATTRAKALVQQILTFSQQQEQVKAPIRLQPILNDVLGFLRAGVPASIEITSTIDADAPDVLADGTQIHQVVMNLVTNAADAIGAAAGVIRIRYDRFNATPRFTTLVPELEPGPYVRLSVRDDGPGMDGPTLERIFEPFFTTKAPGKGTGLGLSVVHGIIKAHGGAVGASSEPGRGATIDVYLPVAATDHPALDAIDGGLTFGAGKHVLVVDDELPLAIVCRKMLEACGYQVTVHSRTEAPLAEFRENPGRFDMALLDFTMPGMSGVALADQMHQIRPDLPIIIMTGYASALNEASMQKVGIRRLLLKPIEFKALVNAVAESLSEPSVLLPE